MNVEIFPLEKVLIGGVSICFGMNQSAVEMEIGKGETNSGSRYYYYNSNMAIDYDNDYRVEFIEFLGGIDGELHPIIYGVPVFETSADDLIELLKQKDGGEIDDSERGYSYAFLNISVGVYRELIPSDITEMIKEMENDGISPDDNEKLDEEKRKSEHWATIGVGISGYYRK